MTTLRHVSQCCSLRYSFNFSHKCPELVGSSSLQSYAKTRITMLITALHSGHYHPRPLRDVHSSRRILRVRRAPRQSLRLVPTNILHNTVMVCLQQLAFLVPTLRPFALVLVRHFPVLQIPVTRLLWRSCFPLLGSLFLLFSPQTIIVNVHKRIKTQQIVTLIKIVCIVNVEHIG